MDRYVGFISKCKTKHKPKKAHCFSSGGDYPGVSLWRPFPRRWRRFQQHTACLFGLTGRHSQLCSGPFPKARAPQTHLAASCVKFRRSRQQCVSRWKDTLPLGHTITKNTECKTKSLWVELPVFSIPGGQKMCSLHRRDACHTTLWKIYRIKVPVSSANKGQGKYCKDLGGAFSCIS